MRLAAALLPPYSTSSPLPPLHPSHIVSPAPSSTHSTLPALQYLVNGASFGNPHLLLSENPIQLDNQIYRPPRPPMNCPPLRPPPPVTLITTRYPPQPPFEPLSLTSTSSAAYVSSIFNRTSLSNDAPPPAGNTPRTSLFGFLTISLTPSSINRG